MNRESNADQTTDGSILAQARAKPALSGTAAAQVSRICTVLHRRRRLANFRRTSLLACAGVMSDPGARECPAESGHRRGIFFMSAGSLCQPGEAPWVLT